MTYIATSQASKETYRVTTGDNGASQSIQLEETTFPIDWRQVATLASESQSSGRSGGHFSLIIAGRSYDIFARRITRADQRDSETYEIHIAGQRFEIKVEDEHTRLLSSLVKGSTASGMASVAAPMPGLVVRVPIEPGATVQEGETVVILEAMKMENDLNAPISGTIQEVRVKKGQAVDQGEVLIIIAGEQES
ncbi:biotin/lipoyl-containing protein [Ktedonobacter racemifer]|uniref:Biotin/lipoyl attachment domain-containing protein n=1 Tax=Ktedonobacter racemifer DSM 44963 TaxID=485913 RepID=D6TEK0_KTERA|nr:biotin/lipoyl-containing protein [Ktedonobacter racemifer]EFH90373.1 biotin/lipoyl attachment domain-containing protein [Ktedonobacter racemifer DSM 44963]